MKWIKIYKGDPLGRGKIIAEDYEVVKMKEFFQDNGFRVVVEDMTEDEIEGKMSREDQIYEAS